MAAVTVGAFALVTAEFLPVGLLPEIARGLHVSEGLAGLMVTLPGVMAAVAAAAVVLLAGTVDRRLVVCGLTGLLVLSSAIAAAAPNLPVMLLGRVLLGAGIGGFWATGPSLAARLVPPTAVPRATATVLAGISVATVLGVPAGTLVGHAAGWRTAFVAAGVVGAVVLAAQARLLPPLPQARATHARDLAALLRRPRVRAVLVAILLLFGAHFIAYTYVAPFLTDVAGIEPGLVSILLLAYGAAGIAGNYAAAAMVRRSLRATFAGTVALVVLVFAGLAALGAAPGVAAALVVLWGLAFGAVPLCAQLSIVAATPEDPAGGSALMVSTLQVAIALGSLAGGRLVDGAGVRSVTWVAGALAVGAVAVIALPGRRRPVEASAAPATS